MTPPWSDRDSTQNDSNSTPQTYHRTRLSEALDLWSVLRIEHAKWYYSREGVRPVKLEPPILSREDRPRQLRVEFNQVWLDLHKGYFDQVPPPLPRTAATQNLVLLLLTAIVKNTGEMEVTNPRTVASLCSSIGLHHSKAGKVLDTAIEEAKNWFKAHGGELDSQRLDPTIGFSFKRPRIEAQRQQQQPFRRKPKPKHKKGSTARDREWSEFKPFPTDTAAQQPARLKGLTRAYTETGELVYLTDDELEADIARRMANRR